MLHNTKRLEHAALASFLHDHKALSAKLLQKSANTAPVVGYILNPLTSITLANVCGLSMHYQANRGADENTELHCTRAMH